MSTGKHTLYTHFSLSLLFTLAFTVQMCLPSFKLCEWGVTCFKGSTGRVKASLTVAFFFYSFLLLQVPIRHSNICMVNQRGSTTAVSQTHTRTHKKGCWQVRNTAEPIITADGHRKSKQLQVPNADARLAKNNKETQPHTKKVCLREHMNK